MNRNPSREEQLFADAVARPLEERRAFLDRACGRDRGLRGRLQALCDAHEASESLAPRTPGFAVLPDEQPGSQIGHYKLLQKLGEGGCGVVWMAEQEEPVRRRVALKVIKAGMDTREVIARFGAERQALAMMDHPGIAKVLDAGATAARRPYFVMELVRGVPITRFSDEQKLTIRARLELFMRVCEAVQHAHQKGIIHRDLKPSNVLVALHESTPMPTVIDFGIAKATQGRLTDATLFTSYDQIVGTPAYMSPEQADTGGLDIDTRSDVYSLGVLLYELLAGRCPFDPGSLSTPNREELRRLIREVEPPRPSTRVGTLTGADREVIAVHRGIDPSRLPLLLAGDLDWIVMKALEKSRARRYDTPMAMAEDIARHLHNEPVRARPTSGVYRVRKFMRRHRLGVGATAVIAGTMIVATAISLSQAVRARQAERVASAALSRMAAERARADDLLGFIFEDLKGPLSKIADLRVLDRVLEKALAYFTSQEADDLDDRTLLKHVMALYQLGGLRMDTGRYQEAERAYGDAYARAAVLVRRNPRDSAMLWARAEAEWGNGFVRYRQGRIPEARAWYKRENATRAELVALEPENPKWQVELAKQQHEFALIAMDDDPVLARQLFRAELLDLQKLLPTAPDPVEVQKKIATVSSLLGMTATRAGDFAEAEQQFAEASKLFVTIARGKPGDRHWDFKLGENFSYQAGVLAITGRQREAQRQLVRAFELLSPLLTHDDINDRWRKAILGAEFRQAELDWAAGDLARAGEWARKVRRELEAFVGKEPTDVGTSYRLILVLRLEAAIQHATSVPEAVTTASRAIEVADRLVARAGAVGIFRAERAAAGVIAGRIALAQGDATAAAAHWQRAQAAIATVDPKNDFRILDPAARLARLLGENERAAKLMAQLAGMGYVPLEPWP